MEDKARVTHLAVVIDAAKFYCQILMLHQRSQFIFGQKFEDYHI